jgi:hypothetical protein
MTDVQAAGEPEGRLGRDTAYPGRRCAWETTEIDVRAAGLFGEEEAANRKKGSSWR